MTPFRKSSNSGKCMKNCSDFWRENAPKPIVGIVALKCPDCCKFWRENTLQPIVGIVALKCLDCCKFWRENALKPIVGIVNGSTPLHGAAYSGDTDVVKVIVGLQEGKNALSARCNQGWTPVHTAAHCGENDALLDTEEGRVTLGVKDVGGNTALHEAAREGSVVSVELLIATEEGRSTLATKGSDSQTALHMAAEAGNRGIAAKLLRTPEGRNPMWQRDESGKTPRDIAAEKGHAAVVRMHGVCQAASSEEVAAAITCPECVHDYSSSDDVLKPMVIPKNGHTACSGCTARLKEECPEYRG